MYEQVKKAARINLHHILSSGLKVIHGARMGIVKFEAYWEARRNLAGNLLPREWVNKELYE